MGLTNLCTKRQRIAELARSKRGVALSTLHHVIDVEWMKEAYRLTRKDGAPGIDGVMAEDYAQNLEANLSDLLERIKSGRYHAPPVRRAYIPKADGSLRPLGLPTFEDKVCQRAIVMVLELVYEQDFLSCSYGFRPGRSAHQALEDLRTGFMRHGLRWVIDLDIEKYVTAQVGDLVQDRRRDFAKDVGSQVRASMMAQPCFLAVEKNERMSAKSTAPSTERKPPEIFWRNFIMRPSRSA